MGQYFNPILLAENKKTVKSWMYSHEYDNGLKLMEHSYIGNNFVSAFESLIKNNPQRVVWAGDYADECKGRKTNTYGRCKDTEKVKPTERFTTTETRYIVNHTKKQFVDKFSVSEIPMWKGTKIHPLPLLTCEGNGRGGGDFEGENKYIGTWARDIISVESKKPIGYAEIKPDFAE
jgi:hypothetical protein